MDERHNWIETDYYRNFECKCGACRNLCCRGWEIDLSMKDYFRLLGLECSEELHSKIECAFVTPEDPSPERFKKIAPNWYGNCPFLSAEHLCMLQRECGEGVIPDVCRVYPRSLKCTNGVYHACCSASCEKVAELLMRAEPLCFVHHFASDKPELSEHDPENWLLLEKQCVHILQDRSMPLAERMTRVFEAVGGTYRAHTAAELCSLLPTFGALSLMFEPYAEAAHQRYRCVPELLPDDLKRLNTEYPMWEKWLENLLVNHVMYMDFPYADQRLHKNDSLHGLNAAYVLLNMVCALPHEGGATNELIADRVSAVFHLIEHTAFYYNCKVLLGADSVPAVP